MKSVEQVLRDMERENQPEQQLKRADAEIARLRKELDEYVKAEQIMIAAGLISEVKVGQAHEIVRSWQ